MDISFDNLRIVFLDVDDVLCSLKTQVLYGHYPEWDEKRGSGESYLKHDRRNFDQYSIGLVNKLCSVTNSYIVVSSTWRTAFGLPSMISMFGEIGIDSSRIIGRTDSYAPNTSRGLQIQRWLNKVVDRDERQLLGHNGLAIKLLEKYDGELEIESYVIIDDLDGYKILPEQEPHLVQTSIYEGLTLTDTLKAGKILTKNDEFWLNALKGIQ